VAVNRRQLWLGGALIVALVAAMVLRSTDDTSTATAARQPVAQGAQAANTAQQTLALQGAADVNLEALTRARGEPATEGRNPFRFQPKPPPPAPAVARLPPDAAPQMPMVPTGPPPPPPIPLKFIGLVEKADGTKIAVLSDGRRPHSGVEGQDIDGRYRIVKIGNESIEMVYLDGRGRQTIRLTGQ